MLLVLARSTNELGELYLVEVLQRIDTHPAFEVPLLTPCRWKQHFADPPLRSDLDQLWQ